MSAYNDEKYLERSITGILNQTYADFELIIIDDGSTDRTPEILRDFAECDPRIRILTQENQGLTRALIKGCAAARGEFICRHDADDYSLPERIEKQVEFLDAHPEVGFVACATHFIGPDRSVIHTNTCVDNIKTATTQLQTGVCGPPAHGSVLIRHSALDLAGSYRDQFYFAQDNDLWFRLVEVTQFACLQDVLYQAALDPQRISGRSGSIQAHFGRLATKCRDSRARAANEDSALHEAATLACRLRNGSLRNRDDRDAVAMSYLMGSSLATKGNTRAIRYLLAVIKRRPLHWKAWFRLIQALATPLRDNRE